jgi:multidrug efflux pump subunit AcrB
MTTVAVFAPLFFLSGIVGKFISSIPFTIIFVLLASIVVALGFVPLLAIFLPKSTRIASKTCRKSGANVLKFGTKDFWLACLKGKSKIDFLPRLQLDLSLLALPVTGLLKVSFFPQDDQDYVFVSIERPQGTPLEKTDLSVREVEEILYTSPYVQSFVTTVGASSALSGSGGGAGSKLANITVMLPKESALSSTEIVEKLREELPPVTSAEVKVDQGNNGPPSSDPVVVTFSGDSLEEISDAASKAENILASIPGTQDVTTSLRDDGTQFEITMDRAKATQVGLSAAQVASLLRTSVSGVTATTIKKAGTDIDIVVKTDLNPDFIRPEDTVKTNTDSIKSIPIATPTGTVLTWVAYQHIGISVARNH